MTRNSVRLMTMVACLSCSSCSDEPLQDAAPLKSAPAVVAAVQDETKPNPLDGLWHGSWGYGERDGVVFQPVIAEMVILGDSVELHGFRNIGALVGTVRFDADAGKLHVTPQQSQPGETPPATIEFACRLDGDNLTLTDSENVPTSLTRRRTEDRPLADVQVEFVLATGIDEAGSLTVTKYSTVRVGQASKVAYEPQPRSLNVKNRPILLIMGSGLRKVTLEEARVVTSRPVPVAIAWSDDEPVPGQTYQLWKYAGAPRPDGQAAEQTLTRLLRPGTLVFVLPARDQVPLP